LNISDVYKYELVSIIKSELDI